MSDDAKPYTSADVPLGPVVINNRRMFATVVALERVTKERDEARRGVTNLLNVLNAVCSDPACTAGIIRRDDGSRVCSAGHPARWVNSDLLQKTEAERDAALAACGEMRAALEHAQANVRALTGGDERRIAKALASDAGRGWVSPEAFDAALREVAREREACAKLVEEWCWENGAETYGGFERQDDANATCAVAAAAIRARGTP